jgi:hypothetical protein
MISKVTRSVVRRNQAEAYDPRMVGSCFLCPCKAHNLEIVSPSADFA